MRLPKKFILTRDTKISVDMICLWKQSLLGNIAKNFGGVWGNFTGTFVDVVSEKHRFNKIFEIQLEECDELLGFTPKNGTAYEVERCDKDHWWVTKLPYIRKRRC